MTRQIEERNCNVQLVHAPKRGLAGVLEDAKMAYPDRELPLQMSFHAKNLELYAGVTWARCIGDDTPEHSKIFKPESIGLIFASRPKLVNRLYEASRHLFKKFFSDIVTTHNGQRRWEETENGYQCLYQETTYSGPCLAVKKSLDGKKFELHLADRWCYGRPLLNDHLRDFDKLTSQHIGEIKFDRVRGQHPSVEDKRYYTFHPAMINGG